MIFGKAKKEPAGNAPGLWQRLQKGLGKTRALLFTDITELFDKKDWSRQELLDEIETRLLMADVGVESTARIIESLDQALIKKRVNSPEDLIAVLHERMVDILRAVESPLVIQEGSTRPFTILVLGVNGTGKTTTIGKLAKLYSGDHSVMLAAGDTFRAAAIEQLKSWGDRVNVPVISRPQGRDAAAVIYDSLAAARADGTDILIADTAGRLQTKSNLMEELKKIRRIIAKFDESTPVEVLLVLDAGNGQNALVQARQFNEAVGVTGIVLTKMDGTAKGGIIFALAETLRIPVRFIGTGEKITDLAPFDAEDFVTALLSQGR